MWSSRDVALIAMWAVLGVVFGLLIGQVPHLITGIPGVGYLFTIVYSITQSVAWPLFEGRRWRIFVGGIILSIISTLIIPEFSNPVAMATILNLGIIDIVFNSFYHFFENKGSLLWLLILTQVFYWSTHSLWILLFSSLYFPFEAVLVTWFIPIMSVMLPIVIFEAVIGAPIGYKIYQQIKGIHV